ncbi:MAG: beta-L-arabinofuranosidase domain-containing protein [Dysgonomonas sp.]|uniref:beta-L-arabinofuranosidase domain-containing protein n=1 Tax=Dysgonomonas sp. TaxID=1891233 RepID=UPI003A89389D
MKRIYIITGLIVSTLCMNAQLKPKVETFSLQDVRLLDSPFKHAEDLDKQYLLELKADRLLSPFLRESGLTPKAESYTNWENTGLDGHIGGHYLSALSLMYASTGDKQIKERLDYMVRELKRCQDANGNGYIGGVPGGKAIWEEVANGNIRAGGFDLNGKWVPLYNIHKTYAGLRDAYLYANNDMAKEMLIKMTDWAINLVSKLSEEQIQDMLRSEHGGLNETFADVAAITGDKKYLKLAHQFSHQLVLNPLLNHEDKLTGMHANTQIPKVLGFKRIADVEGNDSWSEASRFFWETVVEHRSVCIGGNSVGEHFNPTNDFSRVIKSIEGPETCNTYNMLRLSKMLYQTSQDEKYMDYYERALYNHILSTQNPEQGGFVYFTQMRPGHYRVYSQPQTSFWCCVGSGIENHAKYGEMIYAHTDNELYVNLFIPSRLNWKEKNVEVIQENSFPDEAKTQLTINPEKATTFSLKLRYPAWVEKGTLKVTVNGKDYPVSQDPASYISIDRKWEKGDKVVVEMPMRITLEQLPDKSNYYSIFYGPVTLAAKTGTEDMTGLFADDSRGGHIAHGRQIPMKDMPIIVSDPDKIASLVKPVQGKPLTFHLSGLYPEKYTAGLELIPFFRLHESRYIIYWPQATAEGVKEIQQKIEDEEKERIKLDGITADKVVCGEQQPESDHFIQSDKSNTGFIEDIHWREARGWFSYQLKNAGKNANYLYLKYFDRDQNRSFDVFVNGRKVASLSLKGDGGDNLFTSTYPVPESEKGKEILDVKIVAAPNSVTTKIAEVRVLSEDYKH